jgi:hypothetical protein
MKITKTNILLIFIFLIALSLRIFAAHNTHVSTDEMIYSIIPLNIISAEQLGTIEQSPLFFYLNDLGYMMFDGITPISIRLWSIIFGALSIFVIYLISKELFRNKNVALLSSFFFAVSSHAISFNYEMDMVAFFFAGLSTYFFINFLNYKENKSIYLASLFLVLGIMIKIIVVLIGVSFVIIYLVSLKKNNFKISKKEIKTIFIALLIAMLVFSPIFAYNYLTYKEKGTTDYFFSVNLGIGKTVHIGMDKQWETSRFVSITKDKFKQLLKSDFILLLFGIVGLIYSLMRKSNGVLVLFLSLIIFHSYMAGLTGSASHYLWWPFVLSIFAGFGVVKFWELIHSKFKFKHFILLIIIISMFLVYNTTLDLKESREKSITLSLRDYVHQEVSEDAIVIIDPRIYRGIHAWVFNDKHYLEGTHFSNLINSIDKIPGSIKEVPIYYVECDPGTNCGWKPEDFARIFDVGEDLSNYFKKNLEKVAEVKAGHHFKIYKGSIEIPVGVYEIIDRSHVFWFYPVGWKYPELAIDYYPKDNLVHKTGLLILYLDVLLTIFTIPFVLWLVFRKKKKELN